MRRLQSGVFLLLGVSRGAHRRGRLRASSRVRLCARRLRLGRGRNRRSGRLVRRGRRIEGLRHRAVSARSLLNLGPRSHAFMPGSRAGKTDQRQIRRSRHRQGRLALIDGLGRRPAVDYRRFAIGRGPRDDSRDVLCGRDVNGRGGSVPACSSRFREIWSESQVSLQQHSERRTLPSLSSRRSPFKLGVLVR